MRRRRKVIIQDDGKPWDGTIPDWTLSFRAEDWPGDEPWDRWDRWWEAVTEWAEKRMPTGLNELIQLMTEPPDRPWNEADI